MDKIAPNDDENIEEIFIQILKGTDDETVIDSNKLLTFHIYPTTYLITIHGTHYLSWCNAEFQYLKSIVDYHFHNDMNVTIPSDQDSLLETSACFENFATVLEQSQTTPKRVSTPRLILPKPKITDLQTSKFNKYCANDRGQAK